jgi:phosphonate transport system substrate-binding protein
MISPKESFPFYKNLLAYIGARLGRPVSFVDRKKYEEINRLLASGELDVAFVCSGPYVRGHADFGLELLLAPEINGETVYRSYIIVHRRSPIKEFAELRGHTFAFTDPYSNTGALVPRHILETMGETPESYFSRTTFTYAHDKSIEAVARSLVDGAAVDSLIWRYIDKVHPEITEKTKIIYRSEPFAIPPVVVRKDLSTETKAKLRTILLNLHRSPEGREILAGMGADRFVSIEDRAYDSIRSMIGLPRSRAGVR